MKQLLSEVRIVEIKLSDALLFFPLSSHCPYLSLLLPLVAQLRLILFLSECTDTEKLYLGRFSVFSYHPLPTEGKKIFKELVFNQSFLAWLATALTT